MNEYLEGTTELFGKRQDSDAVADAERVISDDDDRLSGKGF